MDEMLNYIFKHLQSTDESLKTVKKGMRNQAGFNGKMAAFVFVLIFHAVFSEIDRHRLAKKVNALLAERGIKEMK